MTHKAGYYPLLSEEQKVKIREKARQKYYEHREERKEQMRKYSKQNKGYFSHHQKVEYKKKKELAVSFLGGKCTRCGVTFPSCCYDFHHKNPTEKEYNVSCLFRWDWDKIEKELKKCILLCSNCHKIVHHDKEIEYLNSEFREESEEFDSEIDP